MFTASTPKLNNFPVFQFIQLAHIDPKSGGCKQKSCNGKFCDGFKIKLAYSIVSLECSLLWLGLGSTSLRNGRNKCRSQSLLASSWNSSLFASNVTEVKTNDSQCPVELSGSMDIWVLPSRVELKIKWTVKCTVNWIVRWAMAYLWLRTMFDLLYTWEGPRLRLVTKYPTRVPGASHYDTTTLPTDHGFWAPHWRTN